MTGFRKLAWLLALVLFPTQPAMPADAQYQIDSRIRYIQELLDALRATKPTSLRNARNYIHVIDQNTCRSAFSDLRTNCLLAAAKRNCRQRRAGRQARRRCRLVADVIVTNKLGEKAFIDSKTKYRIMSSQRDYRRQIRLELWRRYAELVTEFLLSGFHQGDQDLLAAGIDRYCMRAVHQRGLSWQTCVAATSWFIETSRNRID